MQTLKDIGEVSAIERLQKYLSAPPQTSRSQVGLPARADVVQGAGDDCAVVKAGDSIPYDWLITSDPVIEGTHFTGETPAAHIGHKAIGRVLSDLAAMGGEPDCALIDIVAPPETPVSRLEAIYEAASRLAGKYGLALLGGDLSRGQALELHVFAMGRVPASSALLRSGAKPDDLIYVTGSLGASKSGRHLSFEPRVAEGIWLREASWVTALIDVSDGLARDLKHVADMSGTGAELDVARIPVSGEALRINDGISPLDHALYDGEDFELLLTVSHEKEKTFLSSWNETFDVPCTLIGRITDKKGEIELVDKNGKRSKLETNGYKHFE